MAKNSKNIETLPLHTALKVAIELAISSHSGQYDKSGLPYICHPMRVMEAGKCYKEKIVGILHDIIEDTNVTSEQLLELGLDDTVVTAVQYLTKLPTETYQYYINRVATNQLAVRVKLNDLKDNMRLERLPQVTERDLERLEKYRKAFLFLSKQSLRDEKLK